MSKRIEVGARRSGMRRLPSPCAASSTAAYCGWAL